MESVGARRAGGDAGDSSAAGAVPVDESRSSKADDATHSGSSDASRHSSQGAELALGAALVVLALAWFALTLDRTFNLRDEGYLLHMSARVANGEIPHRDFIEAYGPGVFATTALALDAGRFQIRPMRWWIAGVKTAGVLLVFAILLRLTPRSVAFTGGLFAIVFWGRASLNLNAPHAALYTIPIGLLGLLLLMRADAHPTRARYLTIGLAAGVALLFKQSLAAMIGYGLGLAILALAVLRPRPKDEPDAPSMPLVSMALAWALAAGLLLIPMAPFMTVRDYLIHLLPVHLLMLAVAVGVGREDMGLHPSRIAMRRILPFVLGATGVLLPVAILYASWGALGDLIHGMFVFPLTLQNYYLAATLPRPAFALFGLGAALAVTAGLLFTSRRRQSALGAAVAAGISLTASFAIWAQAGGWPMPPDQLWRTSALFDWILPTLLVIAAALLVLRDARSGRRDEVAGGLVALAFFQAFLCFQIFPRAGHNVWLAQGSMVPLATVLAYRAFRSSTVSAEGWRTQCAAVALCLVLPLWLAAPVVADVLGPRLDGSTGRPVGLPHTRGLVVDTDDWKKLRLGDVRALVRHLRRADAKGSPILLIGDQQMIYYVSDRPHLAPEREFLLYSAAAGMIPPGETNRLGDEIIAQRLLTTPQVRVVIPDDPSADRLLALLPAVERVIAGRYEIEARFGSYVVWSRRHDAARTDPE